MQVAGEPPHESVAEQIGSADRADKQGIAGEHAPRFPWVLAVYRDVLRRVARRMKEVQRKIAHAYALVVFDFTSRKLQRRAGPRKRPCADRLQLSSARYKIGVNMCFDRGNDFQVRL